MPRFFCFLSLFLVSAFLTFGQRPEIQLLTPLSQLGKLKVDLRLNETNRSLSNLRQLGYSVRHDTLFRCYNFTSVAIPADSVTWVYASFDGIRITLYNPFSNIARWVAGSGDWRMYRQGFGRNSQFGIIFQMAFNDTESTVLTASQFPLTLSHVGNPGGPSCIMHYNTETAFAAQYACDCTKEPSLDASGFPILVDGPNASATCYAIRGLSLLQAIGPFDPVNIAPRDRQIFVEALYFSQYDGTVRRVLRTSASTMVSTVYEAWKAVGQPSGYFGVVVFPSSDRTHQTSQASVLGFMLLNPATARIVIWGLSSNGTLQDRQSFSVSSVDGKENLPSPVTLSDSPLMGSPQSVVLNWTDGTILVGNELDGAIFSLCCVFQRLRGTPTFYRYPSHTHSISASRSESHSLQPTKALLPTARPETESPPTSEVPLSTPLPTATPVLHTTTPIPETTPAPHSVPETSSPTTPPSISPSGVPTTPAASTGAPLTSTGYTFPTKMTYLPTGAPNPPTAFTTKSTPSPSGGSNAAEGVPFFRTPTGSLVWKIGIAVLAALLVVGMAVGACRWAKLRYRSRIPEPDVEDDAGLGRFTDQFLPTDETAAELARRRPDFDEGLRDQMLFPLQPGIQMSPVLGLPIPPHGSNAESGHCPNPLLNPLR